MVSGAFGGRKLVAPRGLEIRPTPDRVRESLFNILGDLEGFSVLDLFAGTGAISAEALSRGAARAVAVERSKDALAAIAANRRALGLGDDRLEVLPLEVERATTRLAAQGRRFELIFADPPYAMVLASAPALFRAALELLTPGGTLVVEHARRDTLPAPPSRLIAGEVRPYGDTALAFFHLEGDPA